MTSTPFLSPITHAPMGNRHRLGSLAESKKLFEEMAETNRHGQHHVTRYDSIKYNVLRGSPIRKVAAESLKISQAGRNGMHRYDIQPAQNSSAPSLHDYYMADLKKRNGSTNSDGHLFSVRGLANFSQLPHGDVRVLRGSSTTQEQFIHPTDRAPVHPRFDHVQEGETIDNDGQLGAINYSQEPEASQGERGNAQGATARRPSLRAAQRNTTSEDQSEQTLMMKRLRYYRASIEHCDPLELDSMERIMRDKLQQYAAGSHAGGDFQLRSAFRFFDRDGRGVIDLAGFKETLSYLGLEHSECEMVALFARYDAQVRGQVDYYEFIELLLERDFMSVAETQVMSERLVLLLEQLRNVGYLERAGTTLNRRTSSLIDDVLANSDEEFMERQRLRKLFAKIDRNGDGVLQRDEIKRLFGLLGIKHIKPAEMDAIFSFIDQDGTGVCSMEEFFAVFFMKL